MVSQHLYGPLPPPQPPLSQMICAIIDGCGAPHHPSLSNQHISGPPTWPSKPQHCTAAKRSFYSLSTDPA
ncbi:hypothetical protein SRHO_G00073770 [Serrasalmus rhombeus]